MSDGWEVRYGFNPKTPTDAAVDADNDGMSNLEESISGTNPRDPASLFKIDRITVVGGQTRIEFVAVAGKTYTVQYSDAVDGGKWQRVANVAAQPTTHTVTVSSTASGTRRYYRVATPVLP